MNPLRLVVNNAQRSLHAMFPGFFGAQKHNHAIDFGYPERVTFPELFEAYCRNPLARAGVDKTVGKTWESNPLLQEHQRDGTEDGDQGETPTEREIRQRFDDLRLWQHLAECDRRGMVGAYSGLILRLADGRQFKEPVQRVGGGLDGIVEVIPAWAGQLTASQWDTDEGSQTYGQPLMFQFTEATVGQSAQPRQFEVHPDRVIVWSRDGTLNGRSSLEPGYNALLDMEKIRGGSGEGFYKNAKSGLSLEIDKDARLEDMARAAGVDPTELVDKIGEQVTDFNRGFDSHLLMQGIKATPIQVNLPSPEHHFAIAAQSFAASLSIPMKVLLGSQTGERASTEDSDEWARVNMARRTNEAVPCIMALVRRLERFSILPKKDWHLDWADLTEASIGEKIERADKMASVNQKMAGEIVFTGDDIRSVVGMEPLSDAEKFRDEDDDEGAALGGDPEDKPAQAA